MSGRVVITGATGFLGRHVCDELLARGMILRALVRTPAADLEVEQVRYEGMHDEAAIRTALQGARAVVHLAARVHVMSDRAADPLAEFRRINVEGTRVIARLAAESGVRSFLFASSVKAAGEESTRPWTETDIPAPVDPYGISKLEAEQVLQELAASSSMTTSALRLPLVYGPGVRANMLRLFRLVDRGLPLPFGGIRNRRSLLYARNAGAAIAALLSRTGPHEVYYISDGEDLPTPELIRRIAAALGRPARLLPAPVKLLEMARRAGVPGLQPIAARLLGSLAVDTRKLRAFMGTAMPYTVDDGLCATAEWYLATPELRPAR